MIGAWIDVPGAAHNLAEIGEGNGTGIVRHRARLLVANSEVLPARGGGTVVRCEIPSQPTE